MIFKGLIVLASQAIPGGGPSEAPLQHVANRPIVCRVLEQLQEAGVSEVVAVVSTEEAPKLRTCIDAEGPAGLELTYLDYPHDEFLEQSLAAAAEIIGDSACVVHVANGMLAQPLETLVQSLPEASPDLLALVCDATTGAGSIDLPTRRLLRLGETRADEADLDLAGVCLFGPGALRSANRTRWWQAGTLDLVAIAEQLTSAGGSLNVEHVPAWWRYTGGAAELLEMNRFALDALALEHVSHNDPAGNRIEGGVLIDSTASVESSVIVGPVIIGAGASIVEAYIGPYTSIGANVCIEGAELERSIILPGATIMHIGGRLVGSVVGRRARIFRDFSLPRALRLNVGDGGEVSLC